MSKKPIKPERRRVRPPTSQELKLVSCAVCERELIGRQHAEHAHLFGIRPATFILDRPYCFDCAGPVLQKLYSCTTCGKVGKAIGAIVQGGRFYCGPCSEPAPEPWRNLTEEMIKRRGRPGESRIEMVATEATA